MRVFKISLLVVTLLAVFAFQTPQNTGYGLMQKMIEANKKVTGLRFTLTQFNRIEGKMMEAKMDIKMTKNPFQVYLKRQYPDKGLEVLYLHGKNNNKAAVNPGSLLPTLNLDPYGSQMRKNEHHTIHSMGFDKLCNTLEYLANKHKANADKMITLHGIVDWRGRKCYKVELNDPNFKYIDYTVQANENLMTIAKKFMLSEHMILEKNSDKISSYTDVKAGQKILIPSDYAKRTLMFIDKETYMPVAATIYDDKGEYEIFYHDNIVINPTFQADEFTTKFKEYKF